MTKEQIQQEIQILKHKINVANNNINGYLNDIKKLERAFDDTNRLKSTFQREVQEYCDSVNSSLNRLDSNSTFKDYYYTKLKKTVHSKEYGQVMESIDKNRQDLLNRIDNYEQTIKTQRNNVQRYSNRLEYLKIELTKMV
ncbi:MAG: hypothetical protein E7517_00090 [Ruminococcaceae bacterium]|nr:hypothetical protein [Oscillospiraceae bacterium]